MSANAAAVRWGQEKRRAAAVRKEARITNAAALSSAKKSNQKREIARAEAARHSACPAWVQGKCSQGAQCWCAHANPPARK